MSDNKSSKKVAIGVVVASTIGFIAGVLFAPKSGKETRDDIKTAASNAKSELEKKLKAAYKELTEVISEAKTLYEKGSDTVKKDLGKLLDQAKTSQEKVKEILSAVHDGDSHDPELTKALNEAKAAIENLKSYIKK